MKTLLNRQHTTPKNQVLDVYDKGKVIGRLHKGYRQKVYKTYDASGKYVGDGYTLDESYKLLGKNS